METRSIAIDILSDVVCPWCAIAYKRLSLAIRQAELEDDTVIRWHPFELNPQMPAAGENLRQHLAGKYGTTLNGSIEARKRIAQLGKEVGFSFDYFDEMKMFNTREAHLLLQWAAPLGRQNALAEALFAAYFSKRQDISDSATLLKLVEVVGLDPLAAAEVLQDPAHVTALEQAEQRWLSQGFRGVPAIVIGGKELLSGAQETATYLHALQTL
ncbi:Predicted dithiol-disulfide isomerase, DsbA family [Microbulbifer donghaiensis]|uniref:Predicted dithiol-disulfide isomerase, DsbA family n=1 Tax=Microbulbifer donghaiensis TaxID=494016 RepID=A0A1M4UU96_9GAMM|nr:DsbA family oxidoreductase [Microbulbifer donghaiensis]SHE60249.1 Predicted dithiol-disulfide isomerase, DsbA family [Microbulbifer donghaiensis]